MPLPTAQKVKATARSGAELTVLRQQVNKLVDQMRVLTLKLDADAGVTDTTYTALVTDAAGSAARVELTDAATTA